MTIRSKTILTLVAVSLLGTVLLWNFNIVYVLRDWSKYTVSLGIFVGNVAVLVTVAALVLGKILGPLVAAEKSATAGRGLGSLSREDLQKKLRSLVTTFLVVNGVGFFLGPVIQHVIKASVAGTPVLSYNLLVATLYSTSLGLYAALIEIRLTERYALPLLLAAGQTSLTGRKTRSLVSRQFLIGGVLMFLSFGLFFGAGYGFLNEQLILHSGADALTSASVDPQVRLGEYAWKLGVLGLLVMTMGGLALWLEGRPFTERMKALSEGLENLMKEGSRNHRPLVITSEDELGVLSNGFNRVLAAQAELLAEVEDSARVVQEDSLALEGMGQQAGQVSRRIQEAMEEVRLSVSRQEGDLRKAGASLEQLWSIQELQGQRIDRQEASVSQASAAITEMTASIDSVSQSAKAVQDATTKLQQGAHLSLGSMDEMVREIEGVAQAASAVAEHISSIARIAAQTNLLAMNAAIEAAHAGEAGQGFSVVASEVRSLSEQAGGAVKEINQQVKIMAEKTRSGLEKTRKAKDLMAGMASEVQTSAQMLSQISLAMAEQGQGTASIREATEEVVRLTSEIHSLTRKQREEAQVVQDGMNTLGASAGVISTAITGESEAVKELGDFTRNLASMVEKNAALAARLARLFRK